jgi:golgi phosphoprotein 3
MDFSVAELFVILSIRPEKGRVHLRNNSFYYSLTGALLLDYLENGEIKVENRRLIPFFRKTHDPFHDIIEERIMKSDKNRKISYWIEILSTKSKLAFKEVCNSLTKKRIIRIEQKKFLGIIPYKSYWFTDLSERDNLVENLRNVLIYDRKATNKEVMLLSLVKTSGAYSLLSRERGESGMLRKKNSAFLEGINLNPDLALAIKEIQTAIASSITLADMTDDKMSVVC